MNKQLNKEEFKKYYKNLSNEYITYNKQKTNPTNKNIYCSNTNSKLKSNYLGNDTCVSGQKNKVRRVNSDYSNSYLCGNSVNNRAKSSHEFNKKLGKNIIKDESSHTNKENFNSNSNGNYHDAINYNKNNQTFNLTKIEKNINELQFNQSNLTHDYSSNSIYSRNKSQTPYLTNKLASDIDSEYRSYNSSVLNQSKISNNTNNTSKNSANYSQPNNNNNNTYTTFYSNENRKRNLTPDTNVANYLKLKQSQGGVFNSKYLASPILSDNDLNNSVLKKNNKNSYLESVSTVSTNSNNQVKQNKPITKNKSLDTKIYNINNKYNNSRNANENNISPIHPNQNNLSESFTTSYNQTPKSEKELRSNNSKISNNVNNNKQSKLTRNDSALNHYDSKKVDQKLKNIRKSGTSVNNNYTYHNGNINHSCHYDYSDQKSKNRSTSDNNSKLIIPVINNLKTGININSTYYNNFNNNVNNKVQINQKSKSRLEDQTKINSKNENINSNNNNNNYSFLNKINSNSNIKDVSDSNFCNTNKEHFGANYIFKDKSLLQSNTNTNIPNHISITDLYNKINNNNSSSNNNISNISNTNSYVPKIKDNNFSFNDRGYLNNLNHTNTNIDSKIAEHSNLLLNNTDLKNKIEMMSGISNSKLDNINFKHNENLGIFTNKQNSNNFIKEKCNKNYITTSSEVNFSINNTPTNNNFNLKNINNEKFDIEKMIISNSNSSSNYNNNNNSNISSNNNSNYNFQPNSAKIPFSQSTKENFIISFSNLNDSKLNLTLSDLAINNNTRDTCFNKGLSDQSIQYVLNKNSSNNNSNNNKLYSYSINSNEVNLKNEKTKENINYNNGNNITGNDNCNNTTKNMSSNKNEENQINDEKEIKRLSKPENINMNINSITSKNMQTNDTLNHKQTKPDEDNEFGSKSVSIENDEPIEEAYILMVKLIHSFKKKVRDHEIKVNDGKQYDTVTYYDDEVDY